MEPVVHGAAYSVYVRSVRLALEEKGVPYRLDEIDIFAPCGPSAEYLRLHPFGRIPAFEHDGFVLYEARAIALYVDEAFDGPSLQPAALPDRARMHQVIGILDSYAYRTLVWDIYVERTSAPEEGRAPDEARIAAALPQAARVLAVIEELMAENDYLAGPSLSLADLHAAPMIAKLRLTPEGRKLLSGFSQLVHWWNRMAVRPSMERTVFPRETW